MMPILVSVKIFRSSRTGDTPIAGGTPTYGNGDVVEKYEKDGEKLVKLSLTAVNQDDDIKLSGQAVVALC